MKLKDLYTLEDRVKEILETNVETRKDDMYLYLMYCCSQIQDLQAETFADLFQYSECRKMYNIKTFESVSRARRKIQAKEPRLKDEKVSAIRYEQQNIYEDYAIH